MKKSFVTMGLVIALSVGSCMTAFAGWEQTGATWKYQNTEGAYYNDGWHWIDGNGDNIAECYFFNTDSTMLSNTTTPDNFTVNESGAWTVNGVVQTKILNDNTSSTGHTNNSASNSKSQVNNGSYYNDDGSVDINKVVAGIVAGDPEASQIADGIDVGGGASGNANWN